MKIDANSDGNVDWNEFMNYILLESKQLLEMRKDVRFELISKVLVETPCYKE